MKQRKYTADVYANGQFLRVEFWSAGIPSGKENTRDLLNAVRERHGLGAFFAADLSKTFFDYSA